MSNKRPRTEASEGEILRAKNTIKDKLKKFKYVEKESYTGKLLYIYTFHDLPIFRNQ